MKARKTVGLIAVLMTSACASSIQSVPLNDVDAVGEGISYYLPKRLVKIVVERKEITSDRTALAAAFQRSKAAEADMQKGAADATAALDKAQRDHLAAKAAGLGDEIIARFDTAEKAANVNSLIANELLKRRRAEAKAAEQSLNAAPSLTENGETLYEETAALTLLDPVPDTSKRFVAKLHHHWSRSDDWDLTVTPSGLLTSATSNPDGQADEVIVEVAKTVLAFVNPTGAVGPLGFRESNLFGLTPNQLKSQKKMETNCRRVFGFHYELEFDPDDRSQFDKIAHSLDGLCSSFRLELASVKQAVAGVTDIEELCRVYSEAKTNEEEEKVLSDNLVSRCTNNELIAPMNATHHGKAARGLAYRRNRPMTFVLKKTNNTPADILDKEATFEPHQSATFLIPNGAPIEVLPFRPSAIASQKMTASFENGMLTRADFEKPGEAITVAMMPANAIGGAFDLVGELLSLRVDNTGKQTQILTNETSALVELQKLLQAQQDLEKLKAGFLTSSPAIDGQ